MHVNLDGELDEFMKIPSVTSGTRIVELQGGSEIASPFKIEFV